LKRTKKLALVAKLKKPQRILEDLIEINGKLEHKCMNKQRY
jgi:hypothetical protein